MDMDIGHIIRHRHIQKLQNWQLVYILHTTTTELLTSLLLVYGRGLSPMSPSARSHLSIMQVNPQHQLNTSHLGRQLPNVTGLEVLEGCQHWRRFQQVRNLHVDSALHGLDHKLSDISINSPDIPIHGTESGIKRVQCRGKTRMTLFISFISILSLFFLLSRPRHKHGHKGTFIWYI